MAALRRRSKKPSAGNARYPSPSQPEELVLYLDENLCNSRAIQETLLKLGVRFERHLDYFARGTPDETWLPSVGNKGWTLLTTDKRIRYNLIEKRALQRHLVAEFVFTSGNMTGQEMADALEVALAGMLRLLRRTEKPFIAAITRGGGVHLRWPKE